MNQLRILCLSGSLRQASYNSALLNALAILAPAHLQIIVFDGIGQLPLFNPDRETEIIPAITTLKQQIQLADGVIIASPEYAHGISSVLKNALDWLVSDEGFPDMPVALLNASPRASHALAALREVITTMSANIIEAACIAVPLLGSGLDTQGIVEDEQIAPMLLTMLEVFAAQIRAAERTTQHD